MGKITERQVLVPRDMKGPVTVYSSMMSYCRKNVQDRRLSMVIRSRGGRPTGRQLT